MAKEAAVIEQTIPCPPAFRGYDSFEEVPVLGEGIQTKRIEWRNVFPGEILKRLDSPKGLPAVQRIDSYWGITRVRVGTSRENWEVSIQDKPLTMSGEWTVRDFSCTCPEGRAGRLCVHEAVAMKAWEGKHGPWIAEERYYEREHRLEKEKAKEEMARRLALWKSGDQPPIAMVRCFPDKTEGLVFLDMKAALKRFYTRPYYVDRARELLEEQQFAHPQLSVQVERDGSKTLSASIRIHDRIEEGEVSCVVRGGKITSLESSMRVTARSSGYFDEPRSMWDEPELDEYELLLFHVVWEYVDRLGAQDQTDAAAKKFFASQIAQIEKLPVTAPAKTPKAPVVVIEPRIIIEDGTARLSFKIGRKGGKRYILRNLQDLTESVRRERTMVLSKNESLDFSTQEMEPESAHWLEFIQRRVTTIDDANQQFIEKNSYYVRELKITYQQELSGSVLDSFYDNAEGSSCEFQDKTNGIKDGRIAVGHTRMRFRLRADRLPDARGAFAGIIVSGLIPVLLRGSGGNYILTKDYLSRVSRDEEDALRPFRSVADEAGYFRFQVGLEYLQEFYYRILPELLDNPSIEFEDNCAQEAEAFLPPEPVFTFYADYQNEVISLRCQVAYGDRTCDLNEEGEGYRDKAQEQRVDQALLRTMGEEGKRFKATYRMPADEDALYRFLQVSVPYLSRFGEVKGTDAFRSLKIRRIPTLQVGVAVKSGIMDLSLTGRDLSETELLAILESYQVKKKYYRLENGDFIDLSYDEPLRELVEVFGRLDLVPTDVIRKKAHLPIYRALYLDRLLEEHDALADSRDRNYRALVKNFRTIQDADYEMPKNLENILRPYQTYGFKWLRTLEKAGFGGILADEMGLGKTLEMTAVLAAAKEEGNHTPSLVICPASLVFNWQEEIRRFAPDLDVVTLSGSIGIRKKLLAALRGQPQGGEVYDVYVTSYDLLKRDIALYEGITFYACVLDEAQFIKNQKAAVTKAVKAVGSMHRFALTGTPIENRLSELWSIFDFLMPGFLYSSDEFIRRFETAIAKNRDEEATQKLKAMTRPFILRRRKEEVLKDLPAKLEEVRYAKLEGEQQKLYDSQVVHMKQMIANSGTAGEDRMRVFAELTRIRQICCDPSLLFEDYEGESAKRKACMDLIASAIDGGHRMLVFSQFTSMLTLLEGDLITEGIPYYKITGSTPKEKRISLVHAFNEGEVPVFLISLKAGGTGLNLTGADMVVHYDPWWNLAVQNQATDRAHRIGQTRQVTVYKLIMKGTIEEKILELQEAKKDLADAILEGRSESILSMSNEELLALLE